ncbi:MAG TPA: hypothetical protein VG944_21165 [Fimbriimonas sp.]|nr:hypothetical protein [Fimbriimonas sp.]
MSLRNAFHKAAGLFVEMPEEGPVTPAPKPHAAAPSTPTPAPTQIRTVEQVVQQSPGPNLDQIQVPAEAAKQPQLTADGTPDFAAIFSQAGVPSGPFGADEALQVINSLPADLPLDLKRKTVAATLTAMGKAMGVATDTIVADASRKIAALTSFTDQLTAQTRSYQQSVEQRIADLKAQIAECETKITQTNDKLTNVVKLCEAEGARLDDVLEFFTLDIAPSKNA